MIEVVVTTGAIRRAKLQSNHHHQQIYTQLFTGRMPFLLPNSAVSKMVKIADIHDYSCDSFATVLCSSHS